MLTRPEGSGRRVALDCGAEAKPFVPRLPVPHSARPDAGNRGRTPVGAPGSRRAVRLSNPRSRCQPLEDGTVTQSSRPPRDRARPAQLSRQAPSRLRLQRHRNAGWRLSRHLWVPDPGGVALHPRLPLPVSDSAKCHRPLEAFPHCPGCPRCQLKLGTPVCLQSLLSQPLPPSGRCSRARGLLGGGGRACSPLRPQHPAPLLARSGYRSVR